MDGTESLYFTNYKILISGEFKFFDHQDTNNKLKNILTRKLEFKKNDLRIAYLG